MRGHVHTRATRPGSLAGDGPAGGKGSLEATLTIQFALARLILAANDRQAWFAYWRTLKGISQPYGHQESYCRSQAYYATEAIEQAIAKEWHGRYDMGGDD